MQTHPSTFQSGASVYKNWFHSLFASGEGIECQWRAVTGSELLPHSLQTATRLDSLTQDSIKDSKPPLYWKLNYPGIDGALITENEIFAIQVPLRYGKHMSPQGGVDQLRNLVLKEKKDSDLRWRLLFVGFEEEWVSKTSKEWAGKLSLGPLNSNIPVGWCAVDPTERNIAYIGSDGTRFDPPAAVELTEDEVEVSVDVEQEELAMVVDDCQW